MAVNQSKNRSWIRENRYEYEIDLTLDSGAVTTIAPPDAIPGMQPREIEASRRKVEYRVANGATIQNMGELSLTGTAKNGVKMNVISQTANVTKPLAAAREIIKLSWTKTAATLKIK